MLPGHWTSGIPFLCLLWCWDSKHTPLHLAFFFFKSGFRRLNIDLHAWKTRTLLINYLLKLHGEFKYLTPYFLKKIICWKLKIKPDRKHIFLLSSHYILQCIFFKTFRNKTYKLGKGPSKLFRPKSTQLNKCICIKIGI